MKSLIIKSQDNNKCSQIFTISIEISMGWQNYSTINDENKPIMIMKYLVYSARFYHTFLTNKSTQITPPRSNNDHPTSWLTICLQLLSRWAFSIHIFLPENSTGFSTINKLSITMLPEYHQIYQYRNVNSIYLISKLINYSAK